MINQDSKIYVAGHKGLVGSAIVRHLQKEGYKNLVFAASKEVDLREQQEVRKFFSSHKPEYVFLAAAKVGGIFANSAYPASFIYDNLLIAANVVDAAFHNQCKKLMFLGSSCIYPRLAKQPMPEDELLAGPLETTNDAYALAKIASIRLARAYREEYGFDAISVMPTNLYGPDDNYHEQNSHVVPALIRRFCDAVKTNAKSVTIWGSGKALREFMHVDDMANACVFLMKNYSDSMHINIGTGQEVSIFELAEMIARLTGFKGKILTDISKPDGTPRKLLDCSRIFKLGWHPQISLAEGLKESINWYRQNCLNARNAGK